MAYKEILFIIGMPRSGTSWLGQIFDSSPQVRFRLSPLFSYEFKNRINEESSKEEWEVLFQNVYNSSNEFMSQKKNRELGYFPTFETKELNPEYLVIKDTRFHNLTKRLLELNSNLKVVVIVRHPCGVINSWLNSELEFPVDASPLKEWRTGACRKTDVSEFWGFDDWKTVTRMHLKLEKELSDRFILQRYENLVLDPFGETKKLFNFVGIKYTDQTDQFLKICNAKHENHDWAVFKNPAVMDQWREELLLKIKNEIISELKGTELEVFLS